MNKFCKNCGSKVLNSDFCQNCGTKTNISSSTPSSFPTARISSEKTLVDEIFYSEDWRRKKIFAISSFPYFDVMLDKQYLYLIEMPKYSGATLGLILGLIVFNIIGAFIGSSLGSSSDTKKRKYYRSAWINLDYKLISNDFDKDIFIKIPLINLKGNIIFGKNKFTIIQGDKKIVLQKGQKEFSRFNEYIKKYVL